VKSIDIPIIGDSADVAQDDPEFTLNLYGEQVSEDTYTLKPTPGTEAYGQFSVNGGGRGMIVADGRLFGVRGSFFQEMVNGVPTVLGTLASTAGKVGIISCVTPSGDNQILIVDDSHGYVYELLTNVWTQLTGVGGDEFRGGGSQVAYCASSAVVFVPGTRELRISAINDFKTWDTTAKKTVNSLTNPLTALASNGELLYAFSLDGYAIYQDTGLIPFPLSLILAGDKIGILAPNSAIFCERHCYWLGKSSTGKGVFYRHSGGSPPQRISNHSTERNVAKLSTLEDAVSFTYQSLGHTFFATTFFGGNKTMVYDQTTNLWHERCQRDAGTGVLSALPFIATAYFDGSIIGLDYKDGSAVRIDDEIFTDLGNPIVRDRITPVTPKEGDFLTFFQSVELFAQIGNTPVEADDPQIMMRYSIDRGETWSMEDWQQAGGNASYEGRTRWVGLGSAYGMAFWFRVVASQYVSWRMLRIRAE
jgi:hypothetical protein